MSYWTAYLKANYPAEYMAALLTCVGDDKDKMAIYLAECRSMGIKVMPPDVNTSVRDFAPVGTDIRFGLSAVRNVGTGVVASIVASRKDKGDYTDFYDFLEKVDQVACNKKVVESLIKAGAFDSLNHPRKGLLMEHARAIDEVLGLKKAEAIGQFDLFGEMSQEEKGSSFRGSVPDTEWDTKLRLGFEREMLGLYVSGHPLAGVEHILSAQSDASIPDILDGTVPDRGMITVGGILTGLQRRLTKKGDPWASATLEDLAGGVEVAFFPKVYLECSLLLAEDAIVLVKGRVARSEDRLSPARAAGGRSRSVGFGRQGPGSGQHRRGPVHAAGGRPAPRRAAGAPRHHRSAPQAAERRPGDDAEARRRVAGDADVGADGRSEGAARARTVWHDAFGALICSSSGRAWSAACCRVCVWAFTAPGVPYKVLADGRFGALPTTSTYHFVDVAGFALSGIGDRHPAGGRCLAVHGCPRLADVGGAGRRARSLGAAHRLGTWPAARARDRPGVGRAQPPLIRS